MRQILFLLGSCLLFSAPAEGPLPPVAPESGLSIRTDNTLGVEELVEDIFVSGACTNISNIRAIGDKRGIGYFENGAQSIGISRGIILSTGANVNAEGPNDLTDKSGNFHHETGDPDLNGLATGTVKDVAGLSFDFTPLDSIVTFRYVFASEEYCEFVGSIYNDVFGFFIRGPGISGPFPNGGANVALIPGTDDYVSINSVNHLQNSSYYIHNELPADALSCELGAYQANYHPHIQYDGFTQVLTAVLRLIPCETYQIRLVIADVGDNFYDSAVFLEAESFDLGGEATVEASKGRTPEFPAYEGCNDNAFIFRRKPGSNDDFPLSVRFNIAPYSTAEEGLDYAPLPRSVTIPPQASQVRLPVEIYNDGLDETIEFISLILDFPCGCFEPDSARMYISDSPPVFVVLPDLAVCEGSSNYFHPQVEGGIPPYTYLWSDGSTGERLEVLAAGGEQYAVTVADACGNHAADSAQIVLTVPPTATLSGQVAVCEGDTAWLPVLFSGFPPWELRYSVAGVAQAPITGIWSADYALPATLPGAYELLGVSDAACEGPVQGSAWVEVLAIQVEAELEHVSCSGGNDGRIHIRLSGGTPPFSYYWANGFGATLELEGLTAGRYYLVVSDAAGCQKEVAFELGAPPPISPIQPDCERLTQGELRLLLSGGTPPYLYSTDGQNFYGDDFLYALPGGGAYALTVLDAAGCTYQQDFIMPVAYRSIADLPAVLELKIGRTHRLEPQLNIPEHLIANLRWLPAAGLSCVDCLYPELLILAEGVYTLRITDVFGCSSEISTTIRISDEVDIYIPNAFSPNADQHNDRFTVYANTQQVQHIKRFLVFDRWGGLLFQQEYFLPNDETVGWDGTARGQPLDPGIYTYMVEVQLATGRVKLLHGQVLLIR
jgi:gliding motility-associated-like protein